MMKTSLLSGKVKMAAVAAVALAAAVFIWIWTSHPAWITSADTFNKRCAEAEKLIDAGKYEEAEKALDMLVDQMGETEKESRLAGPYGRALELELRIYNETGRKEAARSTYNVLYAFDPDSYRYGPIQIFWKGGKENFSEGQSKIIETYLMSRNTGTILIPLGVTNVDAIRFDPAPVPDTVTNLLSFKVITKSGEEDLAMKRPVGMYNLTETGQNEYKSATNDPALVYSTPELYGTEITGVRITFKSWPVKP